MEEIKVNLLPDYTKYPLSKNSNFELSFTYDEDIAYYGFKYTIKYSDENKSRWLVHNHSLYNSEFMAGIIKYITENASSAEEFEVGTHIIKVANSSLLSGLTDK